MRKFIQIFTFMAVLLTTISNSFARARYCNGRPTENSAGKTVYPNGLTVYKNGRVQYPNGRSSMSDSQKFVYPDGSRFIDFRAGGMNTWAKSIYHPRSQSGSSKMASGSGKRHYDSRGNEIDGKAPFRALYRGNPEDKFTTATYFIERVYSAFSTNFYPSIEISFEDPATGDLDVVTISNFTSLGRASSFSACQ